MVQAYFGRFMCVCCGLLSSQMLHVFSWQIHIILDDAYQKSEAWQPVMQLNAISNVSSLGVRNLAALQRREAFIVDITFPLIMPDISPNRRVSAIYFTSWCTDSGITVYFHAIFSNVSRKDKLKLGDYKNLIGILNSSNTYTLQFWRSE